MPESFFLMNDNGKLSIVDDHPLSKVGMVTDAILYDFDNDNDEDLFIVSEWSNIKIFQNDNGNFIDRTDKLFSDKPRKAFGNP